ncbi:MAG: type II toxin-antitoxin system VapC family toxin [Pseudohongiella sp.]|nr:type II toxin-antitoxin system VapC family toxin [Pseudohongiella sp.]
MKLLLDTNIFLWAFGWPARLSATVRTALENPDNQLFLSAISPWEILVKHGKGKLQINTGGVPIEKFLITQREALGIESLPVTEAMAFQLLKLPPIHGDPFDRLLICQAIADGLTLVTPDAHISRYPIRTLW